jgi:hypothetical protein
MTGSNKTRLNKVFADRADDLIIHGGAAASELRPRKPDRVYGLQQTKRFDQMLETVTSTIQKHTQKRFDITPFGERKDPIIFPFLISESKTERGDSFDSCERQTAFPIWKLLKLQEELQNLSKRLTNEHGGPLAWFDSNRGEDWRVYGCYTNVDEDNTTSYVCPSSQPQLCLGLLMRIIRTYTVFGRDVYRLTRWSPSNLTHHKLYFRLGP